MAKAGNSLANDLMKVCDALENRYGRRKSQKFTDFIEALVYQILELGVPEAPAKAALKRLHDEYTDWNDMRVASVREIEDVLGPKYYRVREKAEDIKHLLADLYTAFRRMDIHDLLNADGIETLRALPETTNIRKDMVERSLLLALDVKVFPCDDDQFRLLKFLGGLPKQLNLQQGVRKVEEALDPDQVLRLSRVLREHVHIYHVAGEFDPQPINFGLKPEKKDAREKSARLKKKTERRPRRSAPTPMAKHSHWDNIKHKKSANDARKASVIARMGKLITVAVQLGGPNIDDNPRLRLAVAKARSAHMNMDAIERAIKKAAGEGGAGKAMSEVTYEGYAPGGVAVVVETLTDNRNRTAPEIKKLFERAGGAIGTPGCVSWQFKDRALFVVENASDDAVIEALLSGDADALEIAQEGDQVLIAAEPTQFDAISKALAAAKLTVASADFAKLPENMVTVARAELVQNVRKLLESLEEQEDVQDIYHNAEFE
jgi:YebC/PmpR family DNA-binding regulatory protein